jgi:hypothetical protein
MYVEVTNMAANPTRVSVAAVSREPLPYWSGLVATTPTEFSDSAIGALLFLGQGDLWKYTGSGPATLELTRGETVHVTARVVSNGEIVANLEPGNIYDNLQTGDLVYVQAQGNGATAGFCANLDGCNDGIDSGEYELSVTVP